MASFQQPFQCLRYVKRQSTDPSEIIIASAGRQIYSINAVDGQRLDVWPQTLDSSSGSTSGRTPIADSEVPPEKKRKISSDLEAQEDNPNEVPTWSSIPLVVISSDGKYVVALTAEDKSIRVLELSNGGALKELSSRAMPKRPIALQLTPDGQTILCADKFGDVHSLPLIAREYLKTSAETKSESHKPAATPLTVHTKRNLESLEQQRRAAELKSTKEKNAANFERQVVIGHVSTLTDLILVSLSGRSYIMTADRDEHIRVSRGIPQAHVIEQYCLGHTSMITKLCVPSWAPNVLVSGGGDGHLFLWDWLNGQPLQKVPLPDALPTNDLIVRGIWDVFSDNKKVILVSLEGLPHLLCYTIEDNNLQLRDTIAFSGNILDVVEVRSKGLFLVSVDAVREPRSTDTWKSSPGTLIEAFQVLASADSPRCAFVEDCLVTQINSTGTSHLPTALDEKKIKEFNDIYYNLGNLRKKHFDD